MNKPFKVYSPRATRPTRAFDNEVNARLWMRRRQILTGRTFTLVGPSRSVNLDFIVPPQIRGGYMGQPRITWHAARPRKPALVANLV